MQNEEGGSLALFIQGIQSKTMKKTGRRTLEQLKRTAIPMTEAPKTPPTLGELFGTEDPTEQAARAQEMAYAPVVALTLLWDGRLKAVTSVAVTSVVQPSDIVGILSDGQRFMATKIAEAERVAQAQMAGKAPAPPMPPVPAHANGTGGE